jgi:hypothetical protein
MPHSLRAKLGGLRYKGILEDKDYKRLCKALDNEKVLEQIRAEQKALITTNSTADYSNGVMNCLDVIDKYTAEGSNKE